MLFDNDAASRQLLKERLWLETDFRSNYTDSCDFAASKFLRAYGSRYACDSGGGRCSPRTSGRMAASALVARRLSITLTQHFNVKKKSPLAFTAKVGRVLQDVL